MGRISDDEGNEEARGVFPRDAGLGFGRGLLERLEARVFSGNGASRRVLEKSGFRHEGTLRRAAVKLGVTHDVCVYGLLRGEAG